MELDETRVLLLSLGFISDWQRFKALRLPLTDRIPLYSHDTIAGNVCGLSKSELMAEEINFSARVHAEHCGGGKNNRLRSVIKRPVTARYESITQ